MFSLRFQFGNSVKAWRIFRLTEIHGVEHRRVKAGEQFLGDDENFRHLVELAEALADLPLLLRVEMEFLQQLGVVVAAGVDNLGILGRQELVERVFVMSAGFAVDADEEGLVAERLDIPAVMLGDELRHLLNPVLGRHRWARRIGAVLRTAAQ